MGTRLASVVYALIVVLVVPLVAYRIAVAGAGHGLGWRGFLLVLLLLPVAGAVLAGSILRVGKRGATLGATGAVAATIVLVVVLVFVTLETR